MLNCTKCNLTKKDEEFPRNRQAVSRRNRFHWCRACCATHYQENRERQQASNRRASIKRRYGLEVEEYDRLVARGCSVCGRNDVRIVMDHCHVTDAVRAPLCDGCNTALGGAQDSPQILRDLADYLERHAAA